MSTARHVNISMNASALSWLPGGISASVAGTNSQAVAQAGPSAASDWRGLPAGGTQIAAVAVLLR